MSHDVLLSEDLLAIKNSLPELSSEALVNGYLTFEGNADEKFKENALDMMRVLSASSVYGLDISDETATAIHNNAKLLENVKTEQVAGELSTILCGKDVLNVLLNYNDVVTTIIPELKPCVGFEQNNPYHEYDIYGHIAHSVRPWQVRKRNCRTSSYSFKFSKFESE